MGPFQEVQCGYNTDGGEEDARGGAAVGLLLNEEARPFALGPCIVAHLYRGLPRALAVGRVAAPADEDNLANFA